MRKFFKSVLPIGAIMMIMASGSVCLGQSSYYLRNDSLVYDNAKAVVDSLYSTADAIDRAPYEQAVCSAFSKYWGKSKVKFNWKELSKAQADVDKIQGEISELDSLQKVYQNELSQTQNLIYGKIDPSKTEADVIADLRSQIEALQQTSEGLTAQISQQQQLLDQSNERLQQTQESVASATNSQSDIAKALAAAQELERLIPVLKNGIASDMVSVDIEVFDKAQGLFNENIDLIGTFDQGKYTVLVDGMNAVTPYRPLIEALNKAKRAMASKYDASINKNLAQEIESLVKNGKSKTTTVKFDNKLLNQGQTAQCQAVISALKEEERSAKNLNYLLDYILREHPDGIEAATYDVATEIANVVNIVNPSQSRYNPLYVNFNNILDALESDLKAQDRTWVELGEYIQQMKDLK